MALVVFGVAALPVLAPIIVLFAAGLAAGKLVQSMGQPPLIGMLLAGVAVRNTLPASLGIPDGRISYVLRGVALAIIMVRAGLGLETPQIMAQPGRM